MVEDGAGLANRHGAGCEVRSGDVVSRVAVIDKSQQGCAVVAQNNIAHALQRHTSGDTGTAERDYSDGAHDGAAGAITGGNGGVSGGAVSGDGHTYHITGQRHRC